MADIVKRFEHVFKTYPGIRTLDIKFGNQQNKDFKVVGIDNDDTSFSFEVDDGVIREVIYCDIERRDRFDKKGKLESIKIDNNDLKLKLKSDDDKLKIEMEIATGDLKLPTFYPPIGEIAILVKDLKAFFEDKVFDNYDLKKEKMTILVDGEVKIYVDKQKLGSQ